MRKKAPEAVRRSLLDHAASIAAEQGINAVTTQAVAAGAGVTKGGLFHHFSSKDALLDEMVMDIMRQLDKAIDAAIAADPEPYGSFTRAYVACALGPEHHDLGRAWKTLGVSLAAEERLHSLWSSWLRKRLAAHAVTDGDLVHEIVRLAADGAWLAQGKDDERDPETAQRLRIGLDELTRTGLK
ncbi:TetR/AcrR family transcriptional regulator [Roseinatronobacter monicus]|uniref:TetR family transcriptional regulator n=1 Tax=Roseinatronobacter monicus TaxID=393481 RepID=A0A543KEX9_9RHOB|nr:TetR/AcrR family transcriptional regulator [Roseinatronobacter monicus]TQM93622.1 TetR family transcriptional regulator [Roseinatronobacter monicus]